MIRILMDAEQAKAGDEIQAAGLVYRIVDVVHGEDGESVTIDADRVDGEGVLELRLDPEAQFEIIAPDQDGQS